MKIIRIKSKNYKSRKLQFGEFLMDFNENSVCEIEVNSSEEEIKLAKTVEDFSDFICLLEDEDNDILEAEKVKNIEYLKKVIDNKDIEIKSLTIANEDLSRKIVELKSQFKAYKDITIERLKNDNAKTISEIDSNITTETSESKEEIPESSGQDDKNLNENIYTEEALKSKTVPELKDILNDVFVDYKNEWSVITKKDDIILYIINKIK